MYLEERTKVTSDRYKMNMNMQDSETGSKTYETHCFSCAVVKNMYFLKNSKIADIFTSKYKFLSCVRI